jgi:hypothetical protein
MKVSATDAHHPALAAVLMIGKPASSPPSSPCELPLSKEAVGVNMRLNAGVLREFHWHTADESV